MASQWKKKKDIVIIASLVVVTVIAIVAAYMHEQNSSIFVIILGILTLPVLVMSAAINLFEFARSNGINHIVPDCYLQYQKEKLLFEIKEQFDLHYERESTFVKEHNEERISFFLNKIGLRNVEDVSEISSKLIRARHLPHGTDEERKEKLIELARCHKVVFDLRSIPPCPIALDFPYFFDFMQFMPYEKTKNVLSAIMLSLIHENINFNAFDGIVLSYKCNYFYEFATKLRTGKPVIKIPAPSDVDRNVLEKFQLEKHIDPQREYNVIFVHDVLLTGKQFFDSIDFLQRARKCNILGIFTLYNRVEGCGMKKLEDKKYPVFSACNLTDEDVKNLYIPD
ncbi:MAG: hypothetical protein ACRC46_03575 [Thermoguttaceae bacterium]